MMSINSYSESVGHGWPLHPQGYIPDLCCPFCHWGNGVLWAPRLSVCPTQRILMTRSFFTASSMSYALSTVIAATLPLIKNQNVPSFLGCHSPGLCFVDGFCFKDFLNHLYLSDMMCCNCNVMVLANNCPAYWPSMLYLAGIKWLDRLSPEGVLYLGFKALVISLQKNLTFTFLCYTYHRVAQL